MENGRCRMHGGKSLAGAAAGQFKHGRYSKYLPTGLQEAYERVRNDPDLLAFDEEIALVTARIEEMLAQLPQERSGEWIDNLRARWGELRRAVQRGDRDAQSRAATAIDALIEEGASEIQQWNDILETAERLRRLKDSERRRRVDIQTAITSERAMLLLTVVLSEFRESVNQHTDPELARRILADASAGLRRVTASRSGESA